MMLSDQDIQQMELMAKFFNLDLSHVDNYLAARASLETEKLMGKLMQGQFIWNSYLGRTFVTLN